MATAKDVMKMITDNEALFVDLRFTDTKGKEQHVSVPAKAFEEDKFEHGHAFDGSSIAGWKGIEASDMLLMPDPTTARMDPFREENTLIITCDVVEPSTGKGYDRDPRSLARRAEAYLKSTGIGDTAYFGPEPEFFIFDSVTWNVDMSGCHVRIKSEEAPWSTGIEYEAGNLAHRPPVKGGYFPVKFRALAQQLHDNGLRSRALFRLALRPMAPWPLRWVRRSLRRGHPDWIAPRFAKAVSLADRLYRPRYGNGWQSRAQEAMFRGLTHGWILLLLRSAEPYPGRARSGVPQSAAAAECREVRTRHSRGAALAWRGKEVRAQAGDAGAAPGEDQAQEGQSGVQRRVSSGVLKARLSVRVSFPPSGIERLARWRPGESMLIPGSRSGGRNRRSGG